MAKQLDSFPAPERTDSKYPWRDWGNGNVWELVKDEDFDTPVPSMRQTVAKAAKRMGTTAKTRAYKRDGVESLVIQFNITPPPAAPKRAGRKGATTKGA